MVLPSIAITRRWSTTLVRVHIHAPWTASSLAASRRPNARRIADFEGRLPWRKLGAARRSASASPTHCPIAANDRAPDTTAASAIASSAHEIGAAGGVTSRRITRTGRGYGWHQSDKCFIMLYRRERGAA